MYVYNSVYMCSINCIYWYINSQFVGIDLLDEHLKTETKNYENLLEMLEMRPGQQQQQ